VFTAQDALQVCYQGHTELLGSLKMTGVIVYPPICIEEFVGSLWFSMEDRIEVGQETNEEHFVIEI
jgi:hypothetical protein